jgi:hypothetical protein
MTLTKNFLVAVAVATPLVISAGVFAPAQAAPIAQGSTISLSGTSATQVSLSNTLVDFNLTGGTSNPTLIAVNAGTGSFISINQTPTNIAANLLANVKDLTLVGGTSNTLLANFVTGIRTGTGVALLTPATLVSFDLTSWTNVSPTKALFNGILKSGSDTQTAIGELILTGSPAGSGYTMTLTAVPTPAALPALIGFGIGLVRKRKAAQLAEAEA